jgi:hypothetical protein
MRGQRQHHQRLGLHASDGLLLVLEDLHDADRGTLDLLLYLVRSLHGARILVVGTYRDGCVWQMLQHALHQHWPSSGWNE